MCPILPDIGIQKRASGIPITGERVLEPVLVPLGTRVLRVSQVHYMWLISTKTIQFKYFY